MTKKIKTMMMAVEDGRIVNADLSEIKQDLANLNGHAERGSAFTRKSIERFGSRLAGVLDKANRIIDGNDRQIAYGEADLNEIEIFDADPNKPVYLRFNDLDLSDPENPARELQLALHRSAVESFAIDAENLLVSMNEGLDTKDWFNQDELDALLAGLVQPNPIVDPGGDLSRADELQAKWGVRFGDLWQLSGHRLICGDCTDRATVDRLMGGERADCVVTDPPYGQNQDGVTNDEPEKLQAIIEGCIKLIPCDNAVIVAFSSPRTFPVWLDATRDNGFKFERMLWMYKAAQETFPWRGWLLKSEAIIVSSKGKGQWQDVHPYSHDCYYKSEVSGQLDDSLGWHGSVKPLDVVSDLIARVSAKGQIVYEPFAGSGTTCIACEVLGRQARMVEIDNKNCAITLQRFLDATGIQPVRVN